MPSTLNFNGTSLGGSSYDVMTDVPWAAPGIPQPKVDVQPVPHGGGISQGVWKQPLVLPVTVTVNGTSMEDVRDKLDAIALVFNVTSDKKLFFENSPWQGRQWDARRTGVSRVEWLGRNCAKVVWEFTMPDATAESRELFEDDSAPSSDAYTFYVPTGGGAIVGGDAEAYPIFLIKATGNCATPQIKNVTTNKELIWATTLTNTQWLRVRTATTIESVERSTDNGVNWTSVIASESGPFPRLQAGVRNEYLLTNCDNSTLEV
ncbi:unnamed protein product, partial [marine sediment metagenome]